MKKKNVLVYVFDGFSDWEASYAMVGIRRSGEFAVRTIASEKELVCSMGGMQVLPDLDFIPEVDLADIDSSNTAMLILPGGGAWEQKKNQRVRALVEHCVHEQIPVAAICGATIFLADLGFLDTTKHTSNDLMYLQLMSSVYSGIDQYVYAPSVCTPFLITANGTAAVEFAADIFQVLEIENNESVRDWFQYFQTIEV